MSIVSLDVFKEISKNPQTAFLGIQEFNPTDLLSWKEIEDYFNNPYLYTKDNVFIIDQYGSIKDLKQKTYAWSSAIHCSAKEIFDDINEGKSFYCANFNKFSNKCNNLSSEIYQNINIPNMNLDFHVYGGLKNFSQSFSIHRDYANNIIFQIDGESHWKVYNANSSIAERNLYSDDNLQLLIDYILKPGDLLYIPMGNYHKCNPLSKRLSISACFFENEKEDCFIDTNWYSFNLN